MEDDFGNIKFATEITGGSVVDYDSSAAAAHIMLQRAEALKVLGDALYAATNPVLVDKLLELIKAV